MNLIRTLTSELKPETISQLASQLGADRGVIGKIVAAAGPAILGLFAKTASTQEGASNLFETIERSYDPSLPSDSNVWTQSRVVDGMANSGRGVLQSLLGAKSDAVVQAISAYTGADVSLVSKIVNIVTGFAANLLDRQVKTQGLSPGGLQQLLSSQKDSILAAIPSDLGGALSSLTGIGEVSGSGAAGRRIESGVPVDRSPISEPSRWGGALPLALGVLAVGALIWQLTPETTRVAKTSPEIQQAEPGAERARFDRDAASGEIVSITLPSGFVLRDVRRSSAEGRIEAYLSDSSQKGPRSIVLESASFDAHNRPADQETSGRELDRVASVLKAYPRARVQIGAPNPERVAWIRKELLDRNVPPSGLSDTNIQGGTAGDRTGLVTLIVSK